jgi:hypothetical protein
MARTFTVAWMTTVEAASPRDAALQVAARMNNPNFTPYDDVFHVNDDGTDQTVVIDLAKPQRKLNA